jgi:pimeloyl-ACP methyl ester carboxylesterase
MTSGLVGVGHVVRRTYSSEAAVRDAGAVLDARGVDRAVVVGWSYGAFVAAHWASRHPARMIGAVLVDGAQPHDWLTDEMEQGIRTAFRRLRWLMVPLRVTGLTPRMTPGMTLDLARSVRSGRVPESDAVCEVAAYVTDDAVFG